MRAALIFGASFFLLVPFIAFADHGGGPFGHLVPDSVRQCAPFCEGCHLVQLFDSLLKFAVAFSVVIATLMFTYAGFLYVTAAANPGNLDSARKIFGNVFLGLVFVLGAWLIVNVIMSVFVGPKLPWNQIECVDRQVVTTPTTQQPSVETPDTRTSPPGGLGQNEAALLFAQNGINVVSSGDCADRNNGTCTSLDGIQRDTVEDLIQLQNELGYDVTVTAGTEVGHQNACHQLGTCVDVRPTDKSILGTDNDPNVDGINNFIREAESVGRCVVFEPKGGNQCPAGVTRCEAVSHSTGSHFSFYSCPQ